MLSNEHMDTLIARDIEGTISGAEKQELAGWLREDPANQAYYDALNDTWDVAADAWHEMPEPDTEANWERFSQKIATAEPAPLKVVHRGRRTWLAAAGIAAVLATGITFLPSPVPIKTVTLVGYHRETAFHPARRQQGISQPPFTLQYNERFAQSNRNIRLEGEAFFDVAPSAAHPFIVHAGASQTEVLGTSFGIKAYGNERTAQCGNGQSRLFERQPQVRRAGAYGGACRYRTGRQGPPGRIQHRSQLHFLER